MKLPKAKVRSNQLRLWPEPLGGHGHVRTVLGDITETLTADLLGGLVMRTDCTADYCPDVIVSRPPATYFVECKAAGRSNQTFVYEGRLEKDRHFAETHSLVYAIWKHSCDTSTCRTVPDLQELFLLSIECCYLLPFSEVYRLAKESPPTKLNSKYGHSDSNPTYGSGYRIGIPKLKTAAHRILEWKVNPQWRKPKPRSVSV